MYRRIRMGKDMGQISVTAMLTCYNRREYTVSCLKTLVEGNPNISFHFVVTDDNSNDGTKEALRALQGLGYSITLLSGDGQLFWNGGMYKALEYALQKANKTDYYMLVNDDVVFFKDAIEKLVARQQKAPEQKQAVIVGATADQSGKTSYGGTRLLSKHFAKFALIEPSEEYVLCDTFNGNCVLMPQSVFFQVGNVDPVYRHSMSDYDYGMTMRKNGVYLYNSAEHIGTCEDNDVTGSWRDTSLSRKIRLQKKEAPKGLPRKDWFYFIRKNYGFLSAIYHSMTPYVRILLGR